MGLWGKDITVAAKQYLIRVLKLQLGFLNSYVFKITKKYNGNTWWDKNFYVHGVSDAKTIYHKQNDVIAQYHYSSVETLILRYFAQHNLDFRNKKVLDLGAGSGHWIDFYARHGCKHFTGIDISEKSYKHLKQKYTGMPEYDIKRGSLVEILPKLKKKYDIVNAIGIMFHIVDDTDWKNTITAISKKMAPSGILIVGGHFGLLDGLNVQADGSGVNKRLRSRRRWVQVLKKAEFKNIVIYKNNAYLHIDHFFPENNILAATHNK